MTDHKFTSELPHGNDRVDALIAACVDVILSWSDADPATSDDITDLDSHATAVAALAAVLASGVG